MPISRFALYFFGLAACSTIAFASGQAGQAVTTDGSAALEAAFTRSGIAMEREALKHRPLSHERAQVAQVDQPH